MSALRMLPVDAEPGFLIPAANFPSLNPAPEFVGMAALDQRLGIPFRTRLTRQAARARASTRPLKTGEAFHADDASGSLS